MKHLFKLTLSLLLIVSISSCKKEVNQSALDGSWELRETNGGYRIAGSESTYPPGNGTIIKFSGSTYEKYTAGKLVDNGTITIQKEKKKVNNDEANFSISFVSLNPTLFSAPFKQPMKLSKKSMILFFGEMASDGFENSYVKL